MEIGAMLRLRRGIALQLSVSRLAFLTELDNINSALCGKALLVILPAVPSIRIRFGIRCAHIDGLNVNDAHQ